MADEQEVIIKIKKIKDNTAHGGAWKIAYADFVTAMMAFFLLLWLLNATEQEVLEGLSNYFTPTARTESGASGSGGLFGGITSNEPGPTEDKKHTAALDQTTSTKGDVSSTTDGTGETTEESTGDVGKVDNKNDEANFNTTKKLLEKAIDELPPELNDLKQSILVDITEEGLRIQFIDQSEKGNFKPGSAVLTERAKLLIQFIAQYISRLPNKISVTGHTASDGESDNKWQLSIDRANATRRSLLTQNISVKRITTVTGKADREPLRANNPGAPQNRRMAVVLLRKDVKKILQKEQLKPPSILK